MSSCFSIVLASYAEDEPRLRAWLAIVVQTLLHVLQSVEAALDELAEASRVNAGLREALEDLERGFAVLPTQPDKTPASDLIRRTRGTPGWRQLVKTPATATEVCDWFELDPTDRRRRAHRRGLGRRRRRRRRPGARPSLPTTATVTTRRGVHAYFRIDRPVRTREYPWGSIRGERAYVVAPCSRRADGGAYAWELTPEDAGIADFAAFENSAALTYIRYYLFQTFYLFRCVSRGPPSTRGPRA